MQHMLAISAQKSNQCHSVTWGNALIL